MAVRIILGPAGIVQVAKLRKREVIREGFQEGVMPTHEYIRKLIKDVGEDDDFRTLKGKYKGLKAEMVILTKRVDDLTKGNSEKGKKDKEKSEKVLGNIIKDLGGKGRRKEKISSKEVVFTIANESSSTLAPEITSDSESECDSQEPLPPLPKLIGAAPSGTSKNLISLSDLTLNMADLTLDTPHPKKTIPSAKVSPTYVTNKKTEKSPAGTPPSSTQPSSSKDSKQKTWFGSCKHCGFRNHLFDDCYSKPMCSTYGSTDHLTKEHLEHVAVKKTLICGSIAHEASDCPKKHLNSRRPRIANRQSEPTEKYSKKSSPKVVFGDDSLGDTEGYGSVNCNRITFTRVAYVNGLKHNLISISQLCDANYKVLFTKTQGTIYNQNDEVILIAPRRRDVYVIDMSSYNKESNACFFVKASPSVN
ncbi:hypothetical protein Tco_0448234 [Tanacetum coccineum]